MVAYYVEIQTNNLKITNIYINLLISWQFQ